MGHGLAMRSGQGAAYQDGLFGQGGGFLPFQTLNQESFENGSLGVLESARRDGVLGALKSGPGRTFRDGVLGDSSGGAAAAAAAAAAQAQARRMSEAAMKRRVSRFGGPSKAMRGIGDDAAVTVSLTPTALLMGLGVALGLGAAAVMVFKSKRA